MRLRLAKPGRSKIDGVRTGSLKRRLVLAVLGLLLVVLLGTGLLVNLLLADRLRSDLHNRVADRAGFAQALLTQNLPAQQLADDLSGQGIFAKYVPKDGGSPVFGRDQQPHFGPPGRGNPPPRAHPTSTVTVTEQGGQLVATVPGTQGSIRLTASLIDIDHTLGALHRIELLAGLGTLLIAGALLTVAIGLAMAPLTRMTRLARRIRDGARGGRLRPTRPNTDLGRTAAAFDEMLDALERAEADAVRAEARMRQFLADASHDLRTPIAGVISTAELVLRENPGRESREQRLVSLIQQAQRAGRLVDDLMLMARLDNGSPMLLPTEFDVAELLWPLGFGTGPGLIRGDRDAVHRILTNLISNARRAGSQIEISVVHLGGTVLIDVSDNGPGVPAGQERRIFERFVRLDESRTSPGAGLGLPIARGLARSMQGDLILLDRAPGATFRLSLPAGAQSGRADGDRLAAGHQLPVLLGKH